MKLPSPKPATYVLVAFTLFANLLLAQQNPVIHLSGTRMRAALDVPEGKTTVWLCTLKPGERYAVIAVGATYQQPSVFELAAGNGLKGIARLSGRPNTLVFTAPADCVEIQVTAAAMQPLSSIPLYLSIKCESCPEDDAWLRKFSAQAADAANLSVAGGVNAQTLITNTLIGGNCFQVNNVTASGNSNSRGTFSNGATNIGLEKGMVMCTGNLSILPGPNNETGANGGFGNNSADDPDLAALTSGNQYDVSIIEFDFTPTASTVQFDFVFGSEEHCEWVGSQFNDVFGFFISGPGIAGKQNLALITGTGTPVATNNVNYLTNSAYYVNNNNSINSPCLLLPTAAANECELDGWTSVFTATANVIPCSTYHIKLAIADVADSFYGSAVFLRANSFDAGGSALAQTVYPGGLPHALEDCSTAYVKFIRDNNDNSQPLTIDFTVGASSTATPGLDYAPVASPVVIPAGQNELLVPVTVFADTLTEGLETMKLLLDDACSCTQTEITFLIQDKAALSVTLPNDTLCPGQSAALNPVVSGQAPFTYLWNTGASTASIVVSDTTSRTYTVTVSDFCGDSLVVSATVEVLPLPAVVQTIGLCPGESYVLNGVAYTAPAILSDTLPGIGDDCDTLRTYVLAVLPLSTLSDTIVFCAGDSVVLNGVAYTMSGTVTDTLSGIAGACDTLITYILEMLPLNARSETVALCPGSSIVIGGTVYNSAGTVQAVAPGTNGACDTLVTYTLEVLPQPVRNQTLAFCPGTSVVIGGVSYQVPGIVVDTLAGAGGACDTVATYQLEFLPVPTRAETVFFCPGDTVIIGGVPFTRPAVVADTLQASGGCDTIVTYILQFQTPAPSTVTISCPPNYNVAAGGNTPATVVYNLPTAFSDCVCPGIALERISGLAPGSVFPAGPTTVCFAASDSCGNSAFCCFQVTVAETTPCDVKVIGCIKYELLGIVQNVRDEKTYRIRVTNSCDKEMFYVAFELPDGLSAVQPANNTLYTGASGVSYLVRNPNASPFHSIRFASKVNGLANGASDIFEFTLPPQVSPNYIHCIAKVAPQSYFEAYLNTFYCPVIKETGNRQDASARGQDARSGTSAIPVFPNPATGKLWADLAAWKPAQVQAQVRNSRGQLVQTYSLQAGSGVQEMALAADLPEGLYFLELLSTAGDRQVARFVIRQ
ncbi:MAG: choice-of-anchor L domain-containing protein [Saprospirales bacterium]|nr:choice-of-anchor L domain-containing protein [Saprospirales bacterium]